LDEN
jgi:hypothetical protein